MGKGYESRHVERGGGGVSQTGVSLVTVTATCPLMMLTVSNRLREWRMSELMWDETA